MLYQVAHRSRATGTAHYPCLIPEPVALAVPPAAAAAQQDTVAL
jgi:hypothetical protein